MRLGLVSPYALNVFGGVQEQVLAMSRELSRRGHEVVVVAPNSDDHDVYDTPARIERFGRLVSIRANGSRAPLTLSWAASRAASTMLHDAALVVVHFHEPFAPVLGYAALRAHSTPAVATFHRSGGGFDVTLAGPLLRRWRHNIDVSVAVSASAAETAARYDIDTEVLFNGFEIERFQAFERIVPDIPTFVVIGRLEERKGVHVAIAALQEHVARHPEEPWQLVIVGDGPQREELVRLAGTTPGIRFTGAVTDEEKRRWQRSASAALCPALFGESFGLVILEAMASEVPVVVSDIDGYRAAAGDCGYLFTPGDPFALHEVMKQALSPDPVAIAKAVAHARQWSMSALVDRYEVLYERARQRFQAR